MKNKFWLAIVAVLIILPSVFGVASYFTTKNAPMSQKGVSDVVMTDLYGEEYSFEKSDAALKLSDISTNMVQFFADVNEKAKPEIALPDPLMGTQYYKVVYNNFGRSVEYKYYFTDRPEYCYYIDDEDKCYIIDRDYATAFLLSKYGRSVFADAKLPTMTTPKGDLIEPASIKWSYKVLEKMPTYTAENPEASSDTVYLMPKQMNLVFEPEASSVSVKITRGTESIYEGMFDERLTNAEIPTNEELTVEVTAKWTETENRKSLGEATYNFICKLTDDAMFYLSANGGEGDVIVRGDFININCTNVLGAPEDIKLTCQPELNVTPVFYNVDSYVRCLLPIPLDATPGDYVITVEADGQSQELKFTLNDKDYGSGNEGLSSDALSEKTIAEFGEATSEVLNAKSEKTYLTEEAFGWPIKGAGFNNITGGFSRKLTNSNGFYYTNNWLRIEAYNDEVMACAPGKVVYTGEHTMTGNAVIIDHGLGLRSIYANMTDVSVKVGDEVDKGDVIGTFGKTGYTDGTVFSFAFNIHGTYVSPYDILDGGDGSMGIVFTTDADVEDIELDEIEITDPTQNPDYDPDPQGLNDETEAEETDAPEEEKETEAAEDAPETENANGTENTDPDDGIQSQE